MEISSQMVFNAFIAVCGAFVSYILFNINSAVSESKAKDAEHDKRIGAIEILIARQYMTRDEFTKKMDSFEGKIDRNFTELFRLMSAKVDK